MKKETNKYGLWLGIWVAIAFPITIWLIWGWKPALLFFVITQFLLMFLKAGIKD
jgi:hypothetical protein